MHCWRVMFRHRTICSLGTLCLFAVGCPNVNGTSSASVGETIVGETTGGTTANATTGSTGGVFWDREFKHDVCVRAG